MTRGLRRIAICAAACTSLVLAGCAAMEDPAYQKTRQGAGIGAAVGAAVGLLSKGDKLQNAAIGAAIGGLAGGAIGNYQDRQEAKLRAQLAGTGVDVVRQGDNITLDMPGNITFATNSADLNSGFFAVLDKVSETLREYDQTMVEVAGHTDSTGTRDYNMALSQRRANSVAAYLTSRGINSQRLITVGAGPDHPIASNSTPEGRQQNRRVELTIVPVQKKG